MIKKLERVLLEHYFISDTHLNHSNILKYSLRWPWLSNLEKSVLESSDKDAIKNLRISKESTAFMDSQIIENINKTIKNPDKAVLWHFGDVLFAQRKHYMEIASAYLSQIKCKMKFLLYGNHDPKKLGVLFDDAFNMEFIFIDPKTGDFRIGQDYNYGVFKTWTKIAASHYAMAIWNSNHKQAINLYGHSHSNAEKWLELHMPNRRAIDIGIDNAIKILGDYRPFTLPEIMDIMSTRKGFWMDHHND